MDPDRERLHICLGGSCNNNCLFCMEEDRGARARRHALLDGETVRRLLSEHAGREEVMFTSGEPTLRPDLAELVAWARREGYRRVGLVSNFRRFAYEQYLRELTEAGLNYLLVSIHGDGAKLHDGLTRTPGSFVQTTRGMRNVQALRRRGLQLRFVTTCVLNKRNMDRVGPMVRFLRSFSPDEVVFNTIQPLGRGARHFRALVPPYRDIVASFHRALFEGDGLEASNLFLLDIPRCATRILPQSVVGFVENHKHFEVTEGIPEGYDGDPGGESALTLVTKDAVDRLMRTKRPDCRRCIHDAACDGVWTRYVEAYGFDEFEPVETVVSGGVDE